MDSSYAKILQQQQLFLQLQILNQQQQHYNYQTILPAPPKYGSTVAAVLASITSTLTRDMRFWVWGMATGGGRCNTLSLVGSRGPQKELVQDESDKSSWSELVDTARGMDIVKGIGVLQSLEQH